MTKNVLIGMVILHSNDSKYRNIQRIRLRTFFIKTVGQYCNRKESIRKKLIGKTESVFSRKKSIRKKTISFY